MSYKLTNISGGQIVCDLAVEGKTLRLDNKQTTTIKDSEITPHIKNLVTNIKRIIENTKHYPYFYGTNTNYSGDARCRQKIWTDRNPYSAEIRRVGKCRRCSLKWTGR